MKQSFFLIFPMVLSNNSSLFFAFSIHFSLFKYCWKKSSLKILKRHRSKKERPSIVTSTMSSAAAAAAGDDGKEERNKIHTVEHASSGASVGIHPFGATVISYRTTCNNNREEEEEKTTTTVEHLFLSRDAKLDGSKAIRGGIPLVFPIFGPSSGADNTMPQHGFARNNHWTLQPASVYDTNESAGCSYQLNFPDDVSAGRGSNNPWATGDSELSCRLVYAVDFNGSRLKTTLTIENTSTSGNEFDFQALFHTYYQVHDSNSLNADQCFVRGLENYAVADKVLKTDGQPNTEGTITISAETDRVYSPTSACSSTVKAIIGVGNNRTVELTAAGCDSNKEEAPVSAVVWNPFKEKAMAMSDFGSDQYEDMLCVEPGILQPQQNLKPGQTFVFEQVLEV